MHKYTLIVNNNDGGDGLRNWLKPAETGFWRAQRLLIVTII